VNLSTLRFSLKSLQLRIHEVSALDFNSTRSQIHSRVSSFTKFAVTERGLAVESVTGFSDPLTILLQPAETYPGFGFVVSMTVSPKT